MITQTPLLRAIKAYGQLLERDLNPLAKLLLLRTPDPFFWLYPGHQGGDLETEQVKNWCGQLDTAQFAVSTIYSTEHKDTAPRLFVIRKLD